MAPAADLRFTRMYEAYYDPVFAYCFRRVGRTDAEDIANEVFMVLWRRIDDVDAESELAWLYAVAYRTIGRRLRGTKRRHRLIARLGGIREPSPETPDTIVVRRDQDRLVVEALKELRPGDAEILRLRMWEQLSASEMATVLDCSVPAAEQRLSRAKKRFAAVLSSRLPAIAEPLSIEKGGRP